MEANKEYQEKKNKEFAQNIEEFEIGEIVVDLKGDECRIDNKTMSSIFVFIKRKNNKHGIDYWQWFDMKRFNDNFRKK